VAYDVNVLRQLREGSFDELFLGISSLAKRVNLHNTLWLTRDESKVQTKLNKN